MIGRYTESFSEGDISSFSMSSTTASTAVLGLAAYVILCDLPNTESLCLVPLSVEIMPALHLSPTLKKSQEYFDPPLPRERSPPLFDIPGAPH